MSAYYGETTTSERPVNNEPKTEETIPMLLAMTNGRLCEVAAIVRSISNMLFGETPDCPGPCDEENIMESVKVSFERTDSVLKALRVIARKLEVPV